MGHFTVLLYYKTLEKCGAGQCHPSSVSFVIKAAYKTQLHTSETSLVNVTDIYQDTVICIFYKLIKIDMLIYHCNVA